MSLLFLELAEFNMDVLRNAITSMSFEERDYLRTFSKRRGPPFYRRFYASRRNKVEEPREEFRTSLTKPNPTTAAKGCLVIFYR